MVWNNYYMPDMPTTQNSSGGGLLTDRSRVLGEIESANASAKKGYQNAVSQSKLGLDALTAANPSESAAAISNYGRQVASTAESMKPLVGNVTNLAGQIADIGSGLAGDANGLSAIGNDILGMNRDSSSDLVRELFGIYDQYDPNNQVSLAVQDATSAFENGQGQLSRTLSRTGVNPSSGRYAALNQQYQVALNTAKAAAATRARQLGLDKQASAFKSLVADTGLDFAKQASTEKTQAASVLGNAVGSYNTAAGIGSSVGSLFGTAGSLVGNAANLNLGYARSVASQENAIAGFMQAEAAADAAYRNSLMSYDANLVGSPVTISTSFAHTDTGGNVTSPGSVSVNGRMVSYTPVTKMA